jgi:hypothetical protein
MSRSGQARSFGVEISASNPHLRLSVDQITVSGQQAAHSGIELTAKAVTITEMSRSGQARSFGVEISASLTRIGETRRLSSSSRTVTPHQQYGKDWRLLPRVVAEDRKSTKSRPPSGDQARSFGVEISASLTRIGETRRLSSSSRTASVMVTARIGDCFLEWLRKTGSRPSRVHPVETRRNGPRSRPLSRVKIVASKKTCRAGRSTCDPS